MSLSLNWTPDWIKRRQLVLEQASSSNYILVTPRMIEESETEKELANLLWSRSLQHKDKLHFPDLLIHPQTRATVFPSIPQLLEQKLEEGYIPVSPGDLIQYRITQYIPSWCHQALYIGQGYVVELIRLKEERKPTAKITLRPISSMFVRGPTIQIVGFPGSNRLECLRKALSSLGYYKYSIWSFNCHNLINSFLYPIYEEGVSNGVLFGAIIIALACTLLLAFVWMQLKYFLKIRRKWQQKIYSSSLGGTYCSPQENRKIQPFFSQSR